MEAAKASGQSLCELAVASTARRDGRLQEVERRITDENQAAGLFRVRVFFWDDIEEQLGEFLDVARKYYPQFFRQAGVDLPQVFIGTWELTYPGCSKPERATIDGGGGHDRWGKRDFDLAVITPYDEITRTITWRKNRHSDGKPHTTEVLQVENDNLITGHRQGDKRHPLTYKLLRR